MKEKGYIRIFLFYYFPVILWAGTIFYFSSIPDLKYSGEDIPLEIVLRKGAHFLEYAVLSLLIWRIFFRVQDLPLNKSVYLSLLFTAIYAASDEFHQSLVTGRTGKIIDVVFDIVSAFLFLRLLTVIVSRKINFWRFVGMVLLSVSLIGMELYMIEAGKLYKENLERIKKEKNIVVLEAPVSVDEDKNETIGGKENNRLPQKTLVDVPFTTQAPYANWDEYHEEACEEASLIMVKYFLSKETIDKETAEREIQAIIKFQLEKYGDYKDSNAEQMVKLARDYYGIENLKVIYDFDKEDIKKYLAKGNPIITPAAGRKLGNPNFTGLGPLYHALVLVGYNENIIITNDPGTRKGESYEYSWDAIYSAIHDFPGRKEDIDRGRKAMIVIE